MIRSRMMDVKWNFAAKLRALNRKLYLVLNHKCSPYDHSGTRVE